MKYMGRKMSALEASDLSPSVISWLGQELEMRGIDAVIYTRYILSILQQDPSDLEPWEAEFFPESGGKAHNNPASSSAPNNTPHVSPTPAVQHKLGKARSSRAEKKLSHFNTEEMKKSAAIECLLSVTEEVGPMILHVHPYKV